MFTGIVQGVASVTSVQKGSNLTTLQVDFPEGVLVGIQRGASISINGCCLTVTEFGARRASFDLVPETLGRTTFGTVAEGSKVNFERSVRLGDEIGGHLLSGHVDGIATIQGIQELDGSKIATFSLDRSWIRFVLVKGYIGIQGASLTVADVDATQSVFKVALIPETLSKTTLGVAKVGDRVNFEIDRTTQAIVETVERVLKNRDL